MSLSVNAFRCFLASSLQSAGSETTFYIDRITTLNGETISTSDFSTFGRGTITIDPLSATDIEFASFTGVNASAVTLTGGIRGLSAKSNTSSTSRMPYHAVGTPVIIAFGVHNIEDIKTYIDTLVAGTIGNASSTVAGVTFLTENMGTRPRAYSSLVTQTATPGLTLTLLPFAIASGTNNINYIGGTTSAFTAPTVYPRIDLIVYSTASSAIAYRTGTEGASPSEPTPTSGDIILASVYHRVGETIIYDRDQTTNGYIKRWYLPAVYQTDLATQAFVTQFQGTTMTANENITAGDAVSFNTSSTIAFDAASNGTTGTTSHTCAAGSSLIVTVKVTGTVSSVTYNGVSMTMLRSQLSVAGDKYLYVYYLSNPSTGANNIVVTGGSILFMAAASYTGVGNVSVVDGITSVSTKTSLTSVFPVLIPGSWAAMAVFAESGTVACQGISARSSSSTNLVLFDSLAPSNGSKRSFSPTFAAGENIIVSIVIEPSLTTSGIYRSIITSNYPNSFVGFATASITSGLTGAIVTYGKISSLSGLSPGRYYYQSTSAGGISLSGSFRPIGYAISATTLLILNN